MKKGLIIAGSIISFLCIIVLALSIFSLLEFKPNAQNIIHDTSQNGDTFSLSETNYVLIYVYAIGSVDCEQYDITITDVNYDYFDRNCDDGDLYTTDDYTFLGELTSVDSNSLEISAEGDVIIVDADDVGTDGFMLVASCGCCFIGLILLIVGLVTGKPKPQVMMIQPDGTVVAAQGQFVQQHPMSGQVINQPQQVVAHPQQYIPQAQETSVEEYSFEQKNDWK